MSEEIRLNAYLERIGFAGSIAPTLATLEALHAAHPATIPFENLDLLAGLPVALDGQTLDRKLLDAHRGGDCFELNMLFLRVLRELGFEARAHMASVLWGRRGAERPAEEHMTLTVDISGMTYLADVGMGGLLQVAPLKLRAAIEQQTPAGTYRLTGADPDWQLEYLRAGDWRPVYGFSAAEVDDAALVRRHDALVADPDWFFRQHLLVEIVTPAARQRLVDTRLSTFTEAGREIRSLTGVADIRDVLQAVFGLAPQNEGLDAALARLVTRNVMAG